MMDEKTMGILYAAKDILPREKIKKFMIEYTGLHVPFTEADIDQILRNAFCTCLNYVEDPATVVKNYFHFRESPFFFSPFDSMVAAKSNIRVRRLNYNTNEMEYINGFGPKKEENYEEISSGT